MLNEFLALSRILTGVDNLDPDLGQRYLDRLASTPFEPFLRQILERFRALEQDRTVADWVREEILGEETLLPTVGQIVLLWYTSAMWDKQGPPMALRYGTQEEYFSGLAWQAIGAHVPGLSGGYFGHWHYRPENEPGQEENA